MTQLAFPTGDLDSNGVDASRPAVSERASEFADIAAMARQLVDLPQAIVTLVDTVGPVQSTEQGRPLGAGVDHLLHRATNADSPVLFVPDARDDERFRDDPEVTCAAGIRFYLGIALFDAAGEHAGVLSVYDSAPHASLPAGAIESLQRLGRMAIRLVGRRALERSNRIAGQIAHADFSGVIVVDGTGCVTYANATAGELFDRAVVGAEIHSLFPPDAQAHADDTARWLESGAFGPGQAPRQALDLRIRCADGSVRTLEAARCGWLAEDDSGMALILRDVTERREARDRSQRFSDHDELTGLPHRTALLTVLQDLLRDSERPLALAVLGLDNFRTVNDTLGHAVGDVVLQVVACRLAASLPEDARIARFGGDEFAIVYPGATDVDAHLRGVLQGLATPCEVDQHRVHLDASIGVALSDASTNCIELIARADLALQRAKRDGGRQMRNFEPDMRTEAHDRRRLDLELRRACSEGEFELHYQPQVCLATGIPTGAEALLRWRHPERGLLTPDKFIDALATSPVGPAVGRWILERACEDAATWPLIEGRQLSLGVNLFQTQLDSERLPGEVAHALARSGLTSDDLELELTETIALRDDGIVAGALANLRAGGIRVAYDDFGTGYASLSVLQRLPVDRLKIDRSFVRDVLGNRGDAAIVRSILLIARNFELRVIAEGVETPAQADLLHQLGCQEAQGFLYSPALPPGEFNHWIKSRMEHLSLRDMSVAGNA
jgi:diguanylate cyclase (GGDEF)-like protein